jgi:hypothetical protein
MEIHKPKAAHSWREFLIEIGTIICGIVIALGLEQVVSNIEWSRKVAETREALGLEIGENLGKLEVRTELAQCVDQRLDALASIVDHASKAGVLPPLPAPTSPPYNSWGTNIWNSALSAQTASHLPAEQLRGYGRFYQVLDRVAGAEFQEEMAWTTLFELAGPGRAFNADDARTYRRAIGQARQMNGLIAGFGVRERQAVDGYHIPFDAEIVAQRTSHLKDRRLVCGAPKGEPLASYGAAPAADFPDYARKQPIK